MDHSKFDSLGELEVAIWKNWPLLVWLVEGEVVVHEELPEWVCQIGVEIEGGMGHIR